MHRWVVLLTLAGCEGPVVVDPPAVHWVYPPAPSAWPLGVPRGRIGRAIAPEPAPSLGITGVGDAPLRLSTPWAVPGDGPVRAIVYGLEHDRPAVELVEIDRRRVVWRDTKACAGPVVGVTADAVVCADVRGTRALGLDGKPRWTSEAPFLAITGDHVIVAGAGEVGILDAQNGVELSRLALPPGVTSDLVIASCGDAGRELYAALRDSKLALIAQTPKGPTLAWSIAVGNVAGIDACDGATVLVTVSTAAGTSLLAIARDTGKLVGHVDGVRGYWPARDGTSRLEIATAAGVALWPRDLSAGEPVALPPLGELLAKRADRRLVRATPSTAVVLDRQGVRAFVPLSELGAVLGDDTILAASWLGATGRIARLVGVPRPWRRPLRITTSHGPLAVPAELRDLPPETPLDAATAVARPGAAMYAVTALALDPRAPALYAATLERAPDDAGHAGIARFELATRAWSWLRADGCGAGAPIAIAAARELVACAAATPTAASVRATTRDGAASWEWTAAHLDAIEAAGDVVIAHDADRITVLDAGDGRVLGRIASDDGGAVRAAVLELDGMTMVVTAERGRVVARLPKAAMLPAWSFVVDGVVRGLAASDAGVVVELEDGDAVRIDARTASVTSLPGLDLVWRTTTGLVTGEAAGGPIPPSPVPQPRLPPEIYKPTDLEAAPAIATPWPPPAAMRDSWQYTLYELTGGLRARNDYGLEPPITPAATRGAAASPLVVAYGPGARSVLVIDPVHGDPLRRVKLPDDAPPNVTFSTIVDGQPVTGTILAAPLRVVVF